MQASYAIVLNIFTIASRIGSIRDMTAEFEVISVINDTIIVITSAIAHGGMTPNAASCSPIRSAKPETCVQINVETKYTVLLL